MTPPPASNVAPGSPDNKGTPFDPVRHIPRMHPKYGYWMPRSTGARRGKRPTAPAAEAEPTPPPEPATPAADPAAAPTTPPVETPSTPPPAAPLPSFADIEAAAGPSTPPDAAPGAEAAKPDDKTAECNAQAEIAAEALEVITGFITGVPEEAVMGKAERAGMVRVLSRWFVARGWVAIGGVMVSIMVVSFFLRTSAKTKTRAKLAEMWAKMRAKKEKPVTGTAVTVAAAAPTPPPPPAAPIPFFKG